MADVVVSATGVPGLVKGDMIKPGAVVVDVGFARRKDGTLCGDVDVHTVEPKARVLCPSPGGIGPLTITTLLHNTVLSAKKHQLQQKG